LVRVYGGAGEGRQGSAAIASWSPLGSGCGERVWVRAGADEKNGGWQCDDGAGGGKSVEGVRVGRRWWWWRAESVKVEGLTNWALAAGQGSKANSGHLDRTSAPNNENRGQGRQEGERERETEPETL